MDGRGLEADDRGELGKGRSRVALQRVEQSDVELVQLVVNHHHIRHEEQICRTIFGLVTITPQSVRGNPLGLWFSCFLCAGLAVGCSKAARRGAGGAPLRPGRRPAHAQPALPDPDAASVELQAARLVFEPFIDLDSAGARSRRCWPKSRAAATAGSRPTGGRFATACARESAGATAGRSPRRTCSSPCARSSIRVIRSARTKATSSSTAPRLRVRGPSSFTWRGLGRRP